MRSCLSEVCVNTKSSKLLVVGCSRQKRSHSGLMPAIERYDGPIFRVLRKFRRENSVQAERIDTYILSAQLGLISDSIPIHNYDRRMTPQRAKELSPYVISGLTGLFEKKDYAEVYLCAGREYLRCLHGYEDVVPQGIKVLMAQGSLGQRQFRLRRWLKNGQPSEGDNAKRPCLAGNAGPATLRGISVGLSTEEVITRGRAALETNVGHPDNFRAWYVEIDGKRVAPKWLATQITGLAVSDFGSSEARRFLVKLGVEVRSIEPAE